MAGLYVPFGPLLSFHAEADDPASQITFVPGKSTTPKIALGWQALYEKQEGSPFEIDLRLLSRAPLKPTLLSYVYLIRAAPGLSGPAAAMDVEATYNALLAALHEDYTVGGASYSGNVGWLRVKRADQVTVMKAWARIEDLPAQLEPGKNVYGYQVPISWTILEGPPPQKAQGFVLDI